MSLFRHLGGITLKSFQYHVPNSLEEACSILFNAGDKGKLLAGGTDLLAKIKQKMVEPEHLISLREIRNLRYIQEDGRTIRIGALTVLQEIADSDVVRRKIPILAEAASQVGSVQVRNRGTLCGNICNASPAADTVPPLICLDARIRIKTLDNERDIEIENFFLGPGKVDLHPGELVTEIVVPVPEGNARGVYLKLGRRKAMDISIVGVAGFGLFRNGSCKVIRLALGSVAPTPIRAKRAENLLKNEPVNSNRISLAANEAASECQPISDVRGSSNYRRQMVKVLIERAIKDMIKEGVWR
jgi:carbon-monoxide dehydrogenase medium subunit